MHSNDYDFFERIDQRECYESDLLEAERESAIEMTIENYIETPLEMINGILIILQSSNDNLADILFTTLKDNLPLISDKGIIRMIRHYLDRDYFIPVNFINEFEKLKLKYK
jgi:hypothetical protein